MVFVNAANREGLSWLLCSKVALNHSKVRKNMTSFIHILGILLYTAIAVGIVYGCYFIYKKYAPGVYERIRQYRVGRLYVFFAKEMQIPMQLEAIYWYDNIEYFSKIRKQYLKLKKKSEKGKKSDKQAFIRLADTRLAVFLSVSFAFEISKNKNLQQFFQKECEERIHVPFLRLCDSENLQRLRFVDVNRSVQHFITEYPIDLDGINEQLNQNEYENLFNDFMTYYERNKSGKNQSLGEVEKICEEMEKYYLASLTELSRISRIIEPLQLYFEFLCFYTYRNLYYGTNLISIVLSASKAGGAHWQVPLLENILRFRDAMNGRQSKLREILETMRSIASESFDWSGVHIQGLKSAQRINDMPGEPGEKAIAMLVDAGFRIFEEISKLVMWKAEKKNRLLRTQLEMLENKKKERAIFAELNSSFSFFITNCEGMFLWNQGFEKMYSSFFWEIIKSDEPNFLSQKEHYDQLKLLRDAMFTFVVENVKDGKK